MNRKRVENKVLNRAIIVAAVVWILLLGGFGAFYYMDRYTQTSTPILDTRIQALEQAVRSDPSNLNARVELAAAYLDKNMVDQAIEQGEAVLKSEPSHQGALFVTGKAYLVAKNEDKVVQYFQRIEDLNKDNQYANFNKDLGVVHYELGGIYLKRTQYDKAVEEFKAAAAADSADADAFFGLGQALMGQQKYDLAIEAYWSTLRLDPEYAPPYEALRVAYEKKGLKDYQAYAEAMLLYTQGDYALAVDQLATVIKSLPNFDKAYLGLGMGQEKLGHKEEAVKAYQKALELDPTDRAARQGLGRLTTGGTG
ncbi:MAG: tetratricopeptide repeat protein [Chloroflexi bacterium]|nr:tetratricopeptide repeat protein [Chloroflexota bacterium]